MILVNNCEIYNHRGKIEYRIENATSVSINQNTIAAEYFVFSDSTNVMLNNNRIKKVQLYLQKR